MQVKVVTSGTVVKVRPGIYPEHVVVKSDIIIEVWSESEGSPRRMVRSPSGGACVRRDVLRPSRRRAVGGSGLSLTRRVSVGGERGAGVAGMASRYSAPVTCITSHAVMVAERRCSCWAAAKCGRG